jgi:hypothetical protein
MLLRGWIEPAVDAVRTATIVRVGPGVIVLALASAMQQRRRCQWSFQRQRLRFGHEPCPPPM